MTLHLTVACIFFKAAWQAVCRPFLNQSRRLRLAIAIALIMTAARGELCLADETPVIDIGRQRELFLDEHLIEKLDGAELVLHPPVPQEIAINHDEPWEGGTCGYHTIFKDGDLYRLYYRGGWGYKIYCYAN